MIRIKNYYVSDYMANYGKYWREKMFLINYVGKLQKQIMAFK